MTMTKTKAYKKTYTNTNTKHTKKKTNTKKNTKCFQDPMYAIFLLQKQGGNF